MCINNLISFTSQCQADSVTGTSGLNIASIGITEEELGDYLTPELQKPVDLFNLKASFVHSIIGNLIVEKQLSALTPKTLVNDNVLGEYPDNRKLTVGDNNINGYKLKFDVETYAKALITSLRIYPLANGTIIINIYDLQSGVTLITKSVTVIGNQINEVDINLSLDLNKQARSIFIGYNTNGISFYEANLYGTNCASCSNNGRLNAYVSARKGKIAIASAKINTNVQTSNIGGGLSLNYSVVCNHTGWICNYRNSIAVPIMYKIAYEIMDFSLNNTQQKNNRTMDTERLQSRKEQYDFEFNRHMDAVLKNMIAPRDPICAPCKQPIKHTPFFG